MTGTDVVQLLQNKLRLWQNTKYDATIDLKIAEMLDSDPLKAQANKRLHDAEVVIEMLERKLSDLSHQAEDK
jgi:hypothetical protein